MPTEVTAGTLPGTPSAPRVVLDSNAWVDLLVFRDPHVEPIRAGNVTVDLSRRIVGRDDVEVHLTPKEYAVLAELAKHLGDVLTHAHLLRVVWGPAHQDQIDYLRVAIRALRQKLEAEPSRPRLLINEPGIGYRLRAEPSA